MLVGEAGGERFVAVVVVAVTVVLLISLADVVMGVGMMESRGSAVCGEAGRYGWM